MGEAESYGASGGAQGKEPKLRAQAQLAWERVQGVLGRRRRQGAGARSLLRAVDRVSPEGYLAAIGGSFLASFWLDSTKHRTAGTVAGLWVPLGLAAALYARILRRSRKS